MFTLNKIGSLLPQIADTVCGLMKFKLLHTNQSKIREFKTGLLYMELLKMVLS